jgi:hypothetical protein
MLIISASAGESRLYGGAGCEFITRGGYIETQLQAERVRQAANKTVTGIGLASGSIIVLNKIHSTELIYNLPILLVNRIPIVLYNSESRNRRRAR